MVPSLILVAALATTSSHSYTVQAGDTLSGIAASHNMSLSQIESANPQIANPDLIFAGERITLGRSPGGLLVPVRHAAPVHSADSGSTSSDLADVPGVPRSFAACVALRESSNGTNAAYNGGVYGIIRASGINVNGQSLAAQKAAFSRLYHEYGTAPWSPSDHC